MESPDPVRMAPSPVDHAVTRDAETPDAAAAAPGATFIGDVMLGRDVGAYTRPEQLAQALDRLRGSRDLIVNLECCVTEAARPAAHAHSAFSGSRELLCSLTAAGVRAANVANNHALDFGAQGLRDTVEVLDDLGIEVLGMQRSGVPIAPFRTKLAGRRLAVFGCCALTLPASFWRAGLLRATDADLHEAIRQSAARGDAVVVYVHWGHEMITVPPPESRQLARRFAELGVRCIVGHGPHVVQGHERVGGCDVFYSLGDAVFDRSHVAHRDWGLAVHLDASPTDLRISHEIFAIQPDAHTPTPHTDARLETAWRDRVGVLASAPAYRARYAKEAGAGFFGKQLRETLRLVRRHGVGGFFTKLRGLRWRHFKLLAYSLRRANRDAPTSR